MKKSNANGVSVLVAGVLGRRNAEYVLGGVEIDSDFVRASSTVSRAEIAMALNVVLLARLLDQVPEARRYMDETIADGRRIYLDHGAIRTICYPGGVSGGVPSGTKAISRLLEPLGYERSGRYPLSHLKMTGFAWKHRDFPETIPQFFVSELDVEAFSEVFQATARRVFANIADPLHSNLFDSLASLENDGVLSIEDAAGVLSSIAGAFARHHGIFDITDYETLLKESPEAAWIATEGNAFNHATDRVENVGDLAEALRQKGYPIKDSVEISASSQVRQTALRAALVEREFRAGTEVISRQVPGSFFEFISRVRDPQTGVLDLAFDSMNAQGIFKMTQAA